MTGAVTLQKVTIPKAVQICQDIQLDPAAMQCLAADTTPVAFLLALIELKLFPDAVRFLARALPKREAAWWACVCARSSIDDKTPPEVVKALEAAELWVYKPTEPNRRNANAAAHSASFENPAAWAAMAAFWSDGSMAPEDAPSVPPADNLTAKAVAGAVMLAAVLTYPEKAQEKYRFFLEQGIDIANGGNGRIWQPT
ncbi:DUF6931 family protein [Methylomonas sp. MED-D]|uniref:Uncharacterized protein n=1 Tax=Methylomonas koyamae TaxID=702114 RepID=A0A177NG43_9GAMM|nr:MULTISPECIES: hypothetical protein [Methylomonas]NJA06529.1 hypothetical protein [Methylococcaceae bacterium WWC4]MDT4330332.1 hypothetical protein [Methylomonas sp. MV1]OAI16845.1 hypothetical protein A1355_09010 [Methylomonas koyamae]OHX37401.1 hypothetical protein BJL95_02440 [Methylomonas sp. LWB]WGS86529.1 hypothetical protein QC632_01935 [Methylomonas sp. UP202]